MLFIYLFPHVAGRIYSLSLIKRCSRPTDFSIPSNLLIPLFLKFNKLNRLAGISYGYTIIRNILDHHTTGTNSDVITHTDITNDDYVSTKSNVITYCRTCLILIT